MTMGASHAHPVTYGDARKIPLAQPSRKLRAKCLALSENYGESTIQTNDAPKLEFPIRHSFELFDLCLGRLKIFKAR